MITLTREEAQQVLDALENNAWIAPIDSTLSNFGLTLRARLVQPEPYKQPEDNRLLMQAYRAIHEKQPEPEPVAKLFGTLPVYETKQDGILTVNAPPQREWQGLTDEEMEAVANSVEYNPLAMTVYEYRVAVQKATSAKLREKNT